MGITSIPFINLPTRLDDDVDAGTLLPDGFLKKTSEEKTMTGQHKFGPPFEFKCRAVPVLLSNSFPLTKDLSNGLRRRMQVIPYKRVFSKDEANPNLFDEIWDTEVSGILNLVIDGFARLRLREKFLEPAACIQARQEWLSRSNPLSTFLSDHCVKDSASRQTISEFYCEYTEYCRDTGVSNVLSQSGLRGRMESLGYTFASVHGCVVLRGIRAPAWGSLRPDVEAASDSPTMLIIDD